MCVSLQGQLVVPHPLTQLSLSLTLFHPGDDGGEVVVQQDHVGRLLGDVRAGDPHGNADVRLLQGWGVVDSISCYRDDGSLRGGGGRC